MRNWWHSRRPLVLAAWAIAAAAFVLSRPLPAAGAALPGCTAFTLADGAGAHNGGTYYQCTVDTTRFPDALCNDGSPAVFQVQPATRPSTKWVVWLTGGSQCQNQASCTARARNAQTHGLVTSQGSTPRLGQGLLSHDPAINPELADANTVQVRYCSSDAWTGGYRAPNGPAGWSAFDVSTWNFLGRAVAKAAVASLDRLGMDFRSATQVVLGGTSAGAFGATMTANDLLPLLPAQAAVLFVQDAAFTLTLGRFDDTAPSPYVHQGTTSPFQHLIELGRTLWQARGDRLCDAAAGTEQEHLACLDSTVVVGKPWIGVPMFVANATLDTPLVQSQICPPLGRCPPPHDPKSHEGIYATFLAKQLAAALSQDGAASLPYTAFAPDTYVHPLLNMDAAFTTPYRFGTTNMAAREAFSDWYRHPNLPGRAYLGSGPGVR